MRRTNSAADWPCGFMLSIRVHQSAGIRITRATVLGRRLRRAIEPAYHGALRIGIACFQCAARVAWNDAHCRSTTPAAASRRNPLAAILRAAGTDHRRERRIPDSGWAGGDARRSRAPSAHRSGAGCVSRTDRRVPLKTQTPPGPREGEQEASSIQLQAFRAGAASTLLCAILVARLPVFVGGHDLVPLRCV